MLAPDGMPARCPAGPVALGSAQWNGWGRGLDNTRYQPEPAIRATDVAKLALKWAFGYPNGSEFGQPTVVDGRLFVTEFRGTHLLARCQNRLHLLDLRRRGGQQHRHHHR